MDKASFSNNHPFRTGLSKSQLNSFIDELFAVAEPSKMEIDSYLGESHIERVPHDLLDVISTYLPLRDFVQLAKCSKTLYREKDSIIARYQKVTLNKAISGTPDPSSFTCIVDLTYANGILKEIPRTIQNLWLMYGELVGILPSNVKNFRATSSSGVSISSFKKVENLWLEDCTISIFILQNAYKRDDRRLTVDIKYRYQTLVVEAYNVKESDHIINEYQYDSDGESYDGYDEMDSYESYDQSYDQSCDQSYDQSYAIDRRMNCPSTFVIERSTNNPRAELKRIGFLPHQIMETDTGYRGIRSSMKSTGTVRVSY